MADTINSLEDLGASNVAAVVNDAPVHVQKLDKEGRAYATGKRKNAIARVWLKPGTGKITINGRDQEVYFARPTLRLVINQPFGLTDRIGSYAEWFVIVPTSWLGWPAVTELLSTCR